jgi:hypothetical protein
MNKLDILKAIVSLVGVEGVNQNSVADEVTKLVPGATHLDVNAVLVMRPKDFFAEVGFPSQTNMMLLNMTGPDGKKVCTPEQAVVK